MTESNTILAWLPVLPSLAGAIMHAIFIARMRPFRLANLFIFIGGLLACIWLTAAYAIVALGVSPPDWPPPLEVYIVSLAAPILIVIIVSYPAFTLQIQQSYADYTKLAGHISSTEAAWRGVEAKTAEVERRTVKLEQTIEWYQTANTEQKEMIAGLRAEIAELKRPTGADLHE